MLSLIRSRQLHTAATAVPRASGRTQRAPRMRSSKLTAAPADWTTKASYYFDAACHTSQTLRHLMKATLADQTLGLKKPAELLGITMAAMLDSIRPGFADDAESLDCFHKLLQMHLSALHCGELQELTRLLNAQRFDHVVIESVIDDEMVAEHGFANGPPHSRQRTLMFTKGLHDAIEQATQAAQHREEGFAGRQRLTMAQAQQARDVLASLAERLAHGGVTLTALACAAKQIALAISVPLATEVAAAVHPLPPASSVSWRDGQLVVELHTLEALVTRHDSKLDAGIMRDLLELLLAQKLFGAMEGLMALSQGQRTLLQREIEQVLSRPPTGASAAMRATAAGVLQRRASFGTMQIFPTAGAMLGHAWISPVLSVVPDRSRKGIEAGKRYMRSGLRLEPTQCTVNEWDIRWLTPTENAELYPAEHAWHLSVPAHWLKLQQSAIEVREEWQRLKHPYRFIGTAPGMPATGCRATVWLAAQRAMDDDTRTLFAHFSRGLPEPDSPTELALRMGQFMQWMEALASGL